MFTFGVLAEDTFRFCRLPSQKALERDEASSDESRRDAGVLTDRLPAKNRRDDSLRPRSCSERCSDTVRGE